MRKSRFTEQQILAMIREHESGMSVSDAQKLIIHPASTTAMCI